jgi:hypothetical protein
MPEGVASRKYLVGGVDGYYAGHLYFEMPIEIPKTTFDTEIIRMSFEIQITTQIHEVIRQLLHQHFERRRISPPERPGVWQWNHGSEEFITNYLGHMLHFVDGMIVDLRDRARR